MQIKDKLDEVEEVKKGHKKGKHRDQHKCKEAQERGQEESLEKELKVEMRGQAGRDGGVKGGHKMERMPNSVMSEFQQRKAFAKLILRIERGLNAWN